MKGTRAPEPSPQRAGDSQVSGHVPAPLPSA